MIYFVGSVIVSSFHTLLHDAPPPQVSWESFNIYNYLSKNLELKMHTVEYSIRSFRKTIFLLDLAVAYDTEGEVGLSG